MHNVIFLFTVCGVLTNPENGQVSYTNGTSFGQTATYSCDKGYNLFGGSIRTCQVTGVWSGSEPTCQCMFLMQHACMCTLILVLFIHRQQQAHPLFRLAASSQKLGQFTFGLDPKLELC